MHVTRVHNNQADRGGWYEIVNDTYLGIELVKNVLEVVTLNRFLRIEQIEELLHELRCDVNL